MTRLYRAEVVTEFMFSEEDMEGLTDADFARRLREYASDGVTQNNHVLLLSRSAEIVELVDSEVVVSHND